jgi:hypothetical protein
MALVSNLLMQTDPLNIGCRYGAEFEFLDEQIDQQLEFTVENTPSMVDLRLTQQKLGTARVRLPDLAHCRGSKVLFAFCFGLGVFSIGT